MEIEVKELLQKKIIKIGTEEIVIDIDEIVSNEPSFYDEIIEKPEKFINTLKQEVELYGITNPRIKFLNWKDKLDISKIRKNDMGRPVKIDGMVNKITESMALVVGKSFECVHCGTIITTPGFNPKACSCGGRKLKEIKVDLEDIRELVLEELQERTGSKQPQKIRVRLTGKLVSDYYSDVLTPGNRISIIGLIDKIKLNNKQEDEIFKYQIKALGISNLDEKYDDTITDEDMSRIEEISEYKPLETLSNSLAPNIWGLNELKKIIVLQLVGGVKKEQSEGKFTRDWINLLVVGDPGCAKSDLAKNILIRTPKSFYASGDNASNVGLTAGVVRDEILGSWSVEAGVLVKANGGLAVIDEMDKFSKEQLKALHTPMELGFVKVSKVVDATLPAETSVLALANPKNGVFENKDLVEQINLPPALLSRFDIIYILKDEINEESDNKIVEIIYSGTKQEKLNEINIPLFRKYVSYARKIKPKLPMEHLQDLQRFYSDVRQKSISRDSNMKGMPIGVRHLQGIIRMAEASAKIRLSEEVSKEDIGMAKSLFYESLIKIGLDEGGVIDLSKIGSGKTLSRRKLNEVLLNLIRSVGKGLTDNEIKKIAEEKNFPMNKFYETLDDLNREGIIISSNGKWKII
ncbi:MAG: AAA family ATPase [Candidatus Thorarchaeota archaeon]